MFLGRTLLVNHCIYYTSQMCCLCQGVSKFQVISETKINLSLGASEQRY